MSSRHLTRQEAQAFRLGKVFHHHADGSYLTLPEGYAFAAPRGITGPLRDLILNSSLLRAKLLAKWDGHCATGITARGDTRIPLTAELKALIDGYDFGQVSSPGTKSPDEG